jgi:hypothetical protein
MIFWMTLPQKLFSKKVIKIYFSRANHLLTHPFKLSNKIKQVREELDEIAANKEQFRLTVHPLDGRTCGIQKQQTGNTFLCE